MGSPILNLGLPHPLLLVSAVDYAIGKETLTLEPDMATEACNYYRQLITPFSYFLGRLCRLRWTYCRRVGSSRRNNSNLVLRVHNGVWLLPCLPALAPGEAFQQQQNIVSI